MEKRLASCFLALLMLIGSFVGSKKIVDNKLCSFSPNAIIAVVASGGSLTVALNTLGGTLMGAMGIDAAELAPIFEAAAAGASQAELLAMFGTFFGYAAAIAFGAAVVA